MAMHHATIALTRRLIVARSTISLPRRSFKIRLPRNPANPASALRQPPQPPGGMSPYRPLLIAVTIGATTGTAYSLYTTLRKRNSHKPLERSPPRIIEKLPTGVQTTKHFLSPTDTSGLELVLFQYQSCPFCCKVRAFLDYMGCSYSVIEVDALHRRGIKWSEQKKVPTVLVRQQDGRYVQMSDSSAIISLLASYLNDTDKDVGEMAKFYPTICYFDNAGKKNVDIVNKYFLMHQNDAPKKLNKEEQQLERTWRLWVDSHLVHLIAPNCYRTLDEAIDSFKYFSDVGEWNVNLSKWGRYSNIYFGSAAMWGIAKILKQRYGLSDDVRSHLYAALQKWTDELKKRNTKFLGGQQPNLADLSVFGILNSMEGCKAFNDCLKHTDIGEWYNNVKELVDKNRGNLIREGYQNDEMSSYFVPVF